ncbi:MULTISPECIES: PilZ domain-containing protein [Pseudorhizobium]|jgi:hypothetical protein|uniref:Pilus assembly protein PilZ n=1 Tax=Pseudorhizobium pelagicum TaxID=1509405 RepID=A0A922TA97_9HYPH|nr:MULTISPECIES: PilZ domain-containing protein [Pseudorhizobium]KEQ04083.1 pilus assembly protein PilZ [Pseudorhizobium pelagicum]KEQ04969.1 pilus assembly protein PilZ [Pseudorhizobium pelagicum]MDY6963153.1 PilZ domain-containing protein [Pseudomonadota bacterium]|tara:strand:+ start:74 stop:412 length:339 start_codon:yes stop_codon:yes gene_type:complete
MPSPILSMKVRSAPRRKTRVAGTVKYFGQTAEGRVVDLSAVGLALDLAGPFHAANGSPVKIESEELGVLEGVVKWCHAGRLGIEFRPNSNAAAQVSAYFRFFHRDIKPILAR